MWVIWLLGGGPPRVKSKNSNNILAPHFRHQGKEGGNSVIKSDLLTGANHWSTLNTEQSCCCCSSSWYTITVSTAAHFRRGRKPSHLPHVFLWLTASLPTSKRVSFTPPSPFIWEFGLCIPREDHAHQAKLPQYNWPSDQVPTTLLYNVHLFMLLNS